MRVWRSKANAGRGCLCFGFRMLEFGKPGVSPKDNCVYTRHTHTHTHTLCTYTPSVHTHTHTRRVSTRTHKPCVHTHTHTHTKTMCTLHTHRHTHTRKKNEKVPRVLCSLHSTSVVLRHAGQDHDKHLPTDRTSRMSRLDTRASGGRKGRKLLRSVRCGSSSLSQNTTKNTWVSSRSPTPPSRSGRTHSLHSAGSVYVPSAKTRTKDLAVGFLFFYDVGN